MALVFVLVTCPLLHLSRLNPSLVVFVFQRKASRQLGYLGRGNDVQADAMVPNLDLCVSENDVEHTPKKRRPTREVGPKGSLNMQKTFRV